MKPVVRYTLLALLAIIFVRLSADAQQAGAGGFPVVFGPTNFGKEFFFSFPTNYDDPSAAQQYIRLYITAPVRTRVEIWTGPVLKTTLYTVANDIVTWDLTKFEAQAVTRLNSAPIPPDQVYRNKAVRIVAESPIVVYGINRTSYTSDGMLLLPTNALGTQYVIASATDVITGGLGGQYLLPSQYLITGVYDGTSVSIETPWKTPNHTEGEVFTVNLNKGDVFSSMSEGPSGDLTGAVIYATKPVAVTAGQNCTFLPDERYWACDHLEEMLFPVSAWGTVYHSVPYATRLKGDMYRIFAAFENTDVFVNGVRIATLNRRGGPQGYGWINYLPPERNLLEFTSNKPIFVAQYNNSQDYDGVPADPFYAILSPLEQYQTSFVFSTPSADFPQNFINLVSDSAGYYDIEIARAGTEDWQKLSLVIPRAVRAFPSQINGVTYIGVSFDILPGTYKMRGPKKFAAYIYGFGTYDSYGYPLSAAVADLALPDTIAPRIDKTVDCFGTMNATVSDLPDDPTVRSNLSSIDLVDELSFNYRLIEVTKVEPGISPAAEIRLTVIDQRQDARAVIAMSDMAGNVSYDTVAFAAFLVEADPPLVDFNSLFIGTNATRTTTLRNRSSRPVTITATALKLDNAGFTIVGPAAPFALAAAGQPGDAVVVQLQFDATTDGSFADSLGIRDECGFRYVAALKANVGTPVIQVTDHDFEAWPVSAPPRAGRIEISNISTGSGRLTVTGVAKPITDAVTFLLPNGLPAFPLELAPGQSQTVDVSFDPAAVQTYTDEIVFSHNAPPNPLNDSIGVLVGRGIEGTLIATDMTWNRERVGSGPHSGTVRLTNIGNSDVRLTGIVSITGDVTDFAVVDPSLVTGKTLTANQSVDLPVTFSPTTTGPRQVVITYGHTPTQSAPVESHLAGFGTIPGLVTQDYDFGSMDVGATPDVARTITFSLPAPQVPDVIDSVTILRFDETGDPDFRMDVVPGLPIVLKRGARESVEFVGYFGALQPGVRTRSVTAVTRDGVDTASNWRGEGISRIAGIDGLGVDFGVLCSGAGTREVKVWNTLQAPLTITAVQLVGLPADFAVDPSLPLPATLVAGDTLRILITYTASTPGAYSGLIRITNTSGNAAVFDLPVSGSSVAQIADASVVLAGTGLSGSGEFGKNVTATVRLEDPIGSGIILQNYRVTITFNPLQFSPVADRVTPGTANPGAQIALVSQRQGEIVFDVAAGAQVTAGGLLSLPMSVHFDTLLTRSISATVTTTDSECLTFITRPDTIAIAPICGLSERLIEITSTVYKLSAPSPNPAARTTRIQYGIGLDGHAKLVLHDARGNLVQVLLDDFRQPATYELELDASALPAGVYYYTLTSGMWKQTRVLNVER